MKPCKACKQIKPFSEFHKAANSRDRLQYECKDCLKIYSAKRRKIKAAEIKAYLKIWYLENKERHLKLAKQWKKNNPHVIRWQSACTSKRIRKNTPKWVDRKTLREFYYNCPKDLQVDHVVPLNGKIVSGLHVLWNLQYLSLTENRRKGNRFHV